MYRIKNQVISVVDPYPHHFGILDQHKIKSGSGSASNKNQDPDPHQSDKLDLDADPDPHQYVDDKPKCMEYEPI